MKQKFENLGLILSRDAQKNLVGGSMNKSLDSFGCEAYMCCWDNDSTNCSHCVCDALPICVNGAHPVKCG